MLLRFELDPCPYSFIAPKRKGLCVGGPHRGRGGTKSRSASPSTVRHSHLWGARNPRVLRSSTSNLDYPCDSGGQHGKSGPNPPTFHGVSGLCMNPWHTDCQVEFKPRVLRSCSWGRLSTCDPHATPWVALGAANSEDPTENTAKKKHQHIDEH